jgi:aromatic-L-amino-acid/L-tryptophan decarboxylase
MNDVANSPLQLTPAQMRELGYRVIDALVDRYTALDGGPAWQGTSREALDAALREPAPEEGRGFEAALDRLLRDVLPWTARIDHPRFMAFVPGVATWPAVLGDLVATGSGIFQGTWLAAAGPSALELTVLDWFRDWLGLPGGTEGLLVSGGSVANLTALACARLTRFRDHDPRAVVYCSTEAHSSVFRAARILGFAPDRIRAVPVDAEHRMDAAALRALAAADAEAGLAPFMAVATAGTTSTGAVDPLPQVAAACTDFGMWMHVDAAYGGFAVLTDRGRAALRGIHLADSVTLDPHKWLYQPFEAGCLLVRNGGLLQQAFHILPPYLQDTALVGPDDAQPEQARAPVNFADRGIQLTRAARGFKLWLSLQTFGTAAYRQAIDGCLDLALHAEAAIRASAELELLTPARLGIVCFRRRGGVGGVGDAGGVCNEGNESDAGDRLNRSVVEALRRNGLGMISSTTVDGRFALRLCILNYRTTAADVEAVLQWISACGQGSPQGEGLP